MICDTCINRANSGKYCLLKSREIKNEGDVCRGYIRDPKANDFDDNFILSALVISGGVLIAILFNIFGGR